MVTRLEALLDQLHLHHVAAVLPDHLERAAREELSYADFLEGLLDGEATERQNADMARRLLQADFPFPATMEQFP
jgi:DNA replication protein DnaC